MDILCITSSPIRNKIVRNNKHDRHSTLTLQITHDSSVQTGPTTYSRIKWQQINANSLLTYNRYINKLTVIQLDKISHQQMQ